MTTEEIEDSPAALVRELIKAQKALIDFITAQGGQKKDAGSDTPAEGTPKEGTDYGEQREGEQREQRPKGKHWLLG